MVDASELAWRMLSRKYGANLCYTPMLHSNVFVKDARYRKDSMVTCDGDKPLIVQFCGNDPEIFKSACLLAEPFCDAIDLNLGCPQAIARKGRYGAFLMDDWELIEKMIKRATQSCKVPITAKMRVYEDLDKTIRYAQMLEKAGASIITVHGRTREQKGHQTGLASWNHIKAVCNAVSVPVIANGNIQYLKDVDRCIEYTGAVGVMSAEGNLYNPAIFTGKSLPSWDMALEYLELLKKYPCPLSYSRGHIFKLFQHIFNLPLAHDLRLNMSKASTIDKMIDVAIDIKLRFSEYENGLKSVEYDLPYPPWLCQPYVRKTLIETKEKINKPLKRPQGSENECLSKKKLKKLQKYPNKRFDERNNLSYEKCECLNPCGAKCEYRMCKSCCKLKCYREEKDCIGHKILVKTKRQCARSYENCNK